MSRTFIDRATARLIAVALAAVTSGTLTAQSASANTTFTHQLSGNGFSASSGSSPLRAARCAKQPELALELGDNLDHLRSLVDARSVLTGVALLDAAAVLGTVDEHVAVAASVYRGLTTFVLGPRAGCGTR